MSLRILVTGTVGESLPPPYAGIPKHCLYLARKWRESGEKVAMTFVYHHTGEDDLGAGAEYFFEYSAKPNKFKKALFLLKYFFQKPSLYLFLFRSYWKIEPRFSRELVLYAAYGVFLDAVMQKFKPDVVLTEAALIKSFMAGQVAKRRHISVVLHSYAEIHDLSIGANKRLSELNRKHYWSSFLQLSNLVLAPSRYCYRGPSEFVPDSKLKVIFFGIDVAKFSSVKVDQSVVRKELHLPLDDFYAIAVGALTWRKGHDHLIRAAGLLKKQGKPIRVILCGPGDTTVWKDLAKAEGVADRVHFFSGLSDVDLIKLYQASDLYCDASNSQRACLGMSLTEGMAVGLPAVVYNAGGLPEVVFENKNGFLVPLNDIDALAATIDKIRQMPKEDRNIMGESGQKLAWELVDINKEAVNVLEEIKNLLKL